MQAWLSDERIWFLLGFPVVIILMLYLSVLLGLKLQGAWLKSSLYLVLSKGPKPLRLVSAAMVGAVTPFCSCTSVPGFIAILEAELGMDTALVFLIASPTLDPAGMAILVWLMGLKFSLIYLVCCFLAAVLGGWFLGKFFNYTDVNPLFLLGDGAFGERSPSWKEADQGAREFVAKLWWVIIFSTVAGFLLFDYVPASMLSSLSKVVGNVAVPLAAGLGLLVYAHMSILVPIGAALMAKGLAPGVVLAFLAAASGISPPELILLRKIVSLRLLATFVAVNLILITLCGFVLNWMG